MQATEWICKIVLPLWAKAWTLVGDLYVQFHLTDAASDRASGSSASSSSRDSRSKGYGRKQKKKSHTKVNAHAHSGTSVDIHQKGESETSESKLLMHNKNIARTEIFNKLTDISEAKNSGATDSDRDDVGVKMEGDGHGRRALAEDMVAKIENLKEHAVLHDAYMQVLQAAKMEILGISEAWDATGQRKIHLLGPKIDRRSIEISANDAIREALSVYESLGELRKQESAYAYFQLACYQRDCCLKFLEQDQKKNDSSKGGNSFLHRVKQYASLAEERNWQKSMVLCTKDTSHDALESFQSSSLPVSSVVDQFLLQLLQWFICAL
ncbi:hypothetical protein HAX54_002647 [Datura stramonium]|uniref:Uncharacterized protein n=1 Tax=Datura stramonium TaxID=4076 RepID=A0ABS8T5I3_DATST|nr:hypothetical protein [Datura stramonium]